MKDISKKIGELRLPHPIDGEEIFEIIEIPNAIKISRIYKRDRDKVGNILFDMEVTKQGGTIKRELNIAGVRIEKPYRRRAFGNLLFYLVNNKEYDLIHYHVITNEHYLQNLSDEGFVIDPRYQSLSLKKGELQFKEKNIAPMDKQLNIFCKDLGLNYKQVWSEIINGSSIGDMQVCLTNLLKQKFSSNPEILEFVNNNEMNNVEMEWKNKEKDTIAALFHFAERIKKDQFTV